MLSNMIVEDLNIDVVELHLSRHESIDKHLKTTGKSFENLLTEGVDLRQVGDEPQIPLSYFEPRDCQHQVR